MGALRGGRTAVLAAFVLLLSFLGAHAQTTDGNIIGTVLDAAGAAVPNATVEAENQDTGVKRNTQTNGQGQYRFNNVPIGRYRITATATGFASQALANLPVELNRDTTANLNLQVGDVTTTVEVTEAAAAVDTTSAQVQSVFTTREAIQLPQASTGTLGVLNLSLLSAGVASSGGLGYGTGPSIGGQRPSNNNFVIEGVDNNDRSVTGPTLVVPNEAVAEFTVLQNQYKPEFGHSSGGVFNQILKSGTNEFRGSLYEYLQNRNLNALLRSEKLAGLTEPPRYDRNRFGGTLGGPIVRNKLFFFANYERIPIGNAAIPAGEVVAPTAAGLQALTTAPGISRTNLDVFRQFVPAAPTANRGSTTVAGVNVPLGLLPISAPSFSNAQNGVGSADWNVTERDNLRFRYVHNEAPSIDTTAILPTFFQTLPYRALLANVGYYRTFSPTVTNELRLSYKREEESFPAGSYDFPGLDSFPNIYFVQGLTGLNIGPNPNAPQGGNENVYQVVNNLSWTLGNHTFKFGYDGRKVISSNVFVQRSRGDYGYSTLERFLLDQTPDDLAQRTVGVSPFSGNLDSHYAFANDEWRMRPNLTLNLGIRYEFVDLPYTNKLQSVNAAASVPGLIEFREPTVQKNNWAPRIGVAWQPFNNNQRTVVRAGFGMAYDQVYQNLGILSLPPQFNSTIDRPSTTAGPFLGSGGIRPSELPSSLTQEEARSFTSTYVPDQKRPYSITWNVGIQQAFAENYTAEVRYVGTRGVNLPVQRIINSVARVTPERSLPTFLEAPTAAQLQALPLTLGDLRSTSFNAYEPYGFDSFITSFSPIGNSVYHGLQAELTRRFSRGLLLKTAYTWSHNIDDSTAALFSTTLTPRRPEDFQNLRRERSSSALDRRHRFTQTFVYNFQPFASGTNWFLRNLVGNWLLNGTYTYESPTMATVQSGTDSNLNGDSAGDRAIINPGGNGEIGSGVVGLTRNGTRITSITAAATVTDPIVAYLALNPGARYIQAGPGAYANGGRNTLALNPTNYWDITVGKRFNAFGENRFFEVRADLYNAFNHSQYVPGSLNTVFPTSFNASRNILIPGDPNFNRPDTAFDSNARVIQLVARFQF